MSKCLSAKLYIFWGNGATINGIFEERLVGTACNVIFLEGISNERGGLPLGIGDRLTNKVDKKEDPCPESDEGNAKHNDNFGIFRMKEAFSLPAQLVVHPFVAFSLVAFNQSRLSEFGKMLMREFFAGNLKSTLWDLPVEERNLEKGETCSLCSTEVFQIFPLKICRR